MGKEIDPYWLQQAPHRAISKLRPLRKAISSQLALSSIELLSLKPLISEEEGTSNEDVGLSNGLHRYMSTWVELYRMAKKAI